MTAGGGEGESIPVLAADIRAEASRHALLSAEGMALDRALQWRKAATTQANEAAGPQLYCRAAAEAWEDLARSFRARLETMRP